MEMLATDIQAPVYELAAFYLQPSACDSISKLRKILRSLPKNLPCQIILEPGEYHFYEDLATELFCYVSNNSEGLKRVAFPLVGLHGLTIDGQGSRLIFHGRLCPFLIKDCSNITIRNLKIDYERAFVSQGIVENSDIAGLTVRTDTECHYYFKGGRIWFHGEHYHQRGFDTGKLFKRDSFLHCLEFDTEKRETAYMARDHYEVPASAFSELASGLLHIKGPYPSPLPKVGSTLVISHDHRDCFGICIDESKDVTILEVSVHHCGAMAIIAQRSENVSILQCTVAPDASNRRMVSSFADASHFVNCRGQIKIIGCRFENMLDDPVNVHGIYSPIRRIIDSKNLEVVNAHYEQAGIQVVDPESEVRFVDQSSLLPIGYGQVRSVEMLNRFTWLVELKSAIPANVRVGSCLESLNWVPDVEIRNCIFGKNRARGPLVTTAGKVRIEHNHFHHAGSAIKISGDCNNWFESGAVKDVIIRGNIFDNCGYGTWGEGIVAIDPEIRLTHEQAIAYHQNISIIENHFQTFHEEIVFARSVEGLRVLGNTVERTQNYPMRNVAFRGLKTVDCLSVESDLCLP